MKNKVIHANSPFTSAFLYNQIMATMFALQHSAVVSEQKTPESKANVVTYSCRSTCEWNECAEVPLMICLFASFRRQSWEYSRLQEQLMGKGVQNQLALSWVPWQSNFPLLCWDYSPAIRLQFLQLRADWRAWVHVLLFTLASSCWPCMDLAWGPHNSGWGYDAQEHCQRAPGLSLQSLDPFFPFMPYGVSPMDYRSTDECARSALPRGAIREWSTKQWTHLIL